jgi:thiol-disulfide isomerase/thioredoxin
MRFNRVLPWYALLLIILLCAFLMKREGFTASTPDDFNTKITNNKMFVLFYSESCGHCTKLLPKWENVATKYPDKMVAFECSSTDPKSQAICKKYGINSYPTMMVIDHGVAQNTYDGDRSEEDLTAFVSKL